MLSHSIVPFDTIALRLPTPSALLTAQWNWIGFFLSIFFSASHEALQLRFIQSIIPLEICWKHKGWRLWCHCFFAIENFFFKRFEWNTFCKSPIKYVLATLYHPFRIWCMATFSHWHVLMHTLIGSITKAYSTTIFVRRAFFSAANCVQLEKLNE